MWGVWSEEGEEMLFRPTLFCGRVRAVVYVKGRSRCDHCKDESLGEGSVLGKPHVARLLRLGAVAGRILRKHNCCCCGFRASKPGFSQACSMQMKCRYSCAMFLKCGKTCESKMLARVQLILLAHVEDNCLSFL